MPLLSIILVIVIIGFFMWMINSFVPMAAPIKSILNALVVILLILWLLSAFGIIHGFGMGNLKLG